VEATAVGNILAQMIAAGIIAGLAEAREVVRASFPTKTFEPRDVDRWEEAYARYSRVIGETER
jgi:rhamnulokinase